ncbi:hypothetical protein M413DRAFT_247180 [Hebeloma cylindrosporum]|uniref:Uncharacterized protein n=1 Tax=Hebeloma cylindrosporum TaxID=76867 RepID=A0A0C3C1R6_HEBCY|nr:hypothetical protein M413DRAFT_247180 [Hebeloma cylindrosporum h7]
MEVNLGLSRKENRYHISLLVAASPSLTGVKQRQNRSVKLVRMRFGRLEVTSCKRYDSGRGLKK